MKPSPLRGKLVAALMTNGNVSASRETADRIVDLVLETVAAATPAEIVEEGTYLLGSSHMWADTQGTKATEHMVRRVTAADQVVRSRLERDLERAREAAKEGSDLRGRLTGHSWSSKAVMHEVLAVMERQD